MNSRRGAEEVAEQLIDFVERVGALQLEIMAAIPVKLSDAEEFELVLGLPWMFDGTPQKYSLTERYQQAELLLRAVVHLLKGIDPHPEGYVVEKVGKALAFFNLQVVEAGAEGDGQEEI